jgi:hypothetical protein
MQVSGIVGPWQIIIILFIIFIFVLHIIAFVDILKNEFTESNKIVWIIIVFIFPIIGTILYYFIGTKQKVEKISEK